MTLPDFTRSTSAWTFAQRRRAAILCAVITLPFSIVYAVWYDYIFQQADTHFYLALAAGQPTMLPFASRQLSPLIVRELVRHLGFTLHSAFFLEGTVAFLLFFATVLYYILRSGAPRFMLTAIFGMVFWVWQYNALVMPDLVYAALLCVFLLLLDRQKFFLAGLMMLPLAVSRESTILTLACYLFAGWRRLRLTEAATALFSTVAGMLVVKHLTATTALPNQENISPILYLFAKMPWTLLKNFLGIYPWASVYPECEVPRWQHTLPFGPVHAVGVCGFEPVPPLLLVYYGLASFGLLPLLFLAVRRIRKPLTPVPGNPRAEIFLRFLVIYGVISFLLAGLLGETFLRLFAYAWPVFLIALPILLTKAGANFISNRAAVTFLALHLLLSWCNAHKDQYRVIPFEIALWIAGYLLLRRTLIVVPIPTGAP